MPILKRSSYYDKDYRMGAALSRARQPYLVKNAVTGVCIFGFAVGVYAYTIRAISQDDFEDVPIPDKPVQPPHAPNASPSTSVGKS